MGGGRRGKEEKGGAREKKKSKRSKEEKKGGRGTKEIEWPFLERLDAIAVTAVTEFSCIGHRNQYRCDDGSVVCSVFNEILSHLPFRDPEGQLANLPTCQLPGPTCKKNESTFRKKEDVFFKQRGDRKKRKEGERVM